MSMMSAPVATTMMPGVRPSATLANHDLLPTGPEQRSWRWFHFAALWVGMVISIPAYMLAAGLIEQGMTPLMAIFTILLGNAVVLVPMLLIGHAGARYGIPYAVLLRSSFGTIGARMPAAARAIVACGWYGIQTWIGGNTLLALLQLLGLVPNQVMSPLPLLGIDMAHLASFLAFWLIQLAFVSKGLEMIRKLETWTAPVKILICAALLGWAYRHGGSLAGPADDARSTTVPAALFWPSLTAMVGYWATMALNIPDFTRFAKSQRDQILGQGLGLPVPMGLLAAVAVITTAATRIAFGRAIWDPVELAGHLPNAGVLVGLLIISIDTVSCNIAANLVGPAYDFSALAPQHISYRRGAALTALIAACIMPWRLIADSNGYIFQWLTGYSALLGPIAGIMVADYWLVRQGRILINDLYADRGAYRFHRGYNPVAFAAFTLGVLPNLPGFVAVAAPAWATDVPELFKTCYAYAWFVGAGISGVLYVLGMKLPSKSVAPQALA